MHEAELRIRFEDRLKAEAILRALEPDNKTAPEGLTVEGYVSDSTLVIKVRTKLGVGTLLNTLDDLVICLSTADRCISDAVQSRSDAF